MKKKNLLIIGAGQYGALVREVAEATGLFERISFLDDKNPIAIGKLSDYAKYREEYDCAIVAIGAAQVRIEWIEKLETAGFELPVLIHPSAWVSPSAVLRSASLVEPMAVVHTGTAIEKGGLLCAGSVVNHNSHVGCCCQIDCNAVVAARAIVPAFSKIPCGTVFENQ